MNARFVDATGDFVYGTVPHFPDRANDAERAVARLVTTFGQAVDDARAVEPGPRIPIVVLTSENMYWRTDEALREWRASHEAIAAAGPGRRLIVAEGSGHDIAVDRPDLLVEAVLSLIGM